MVTQGADDNGSGTVACIDLLRRFKESGIQFNRTVNVVLFDAEEPGACVRMIGKGSHHFVYSLSEEQLGNIKLMFNIDMIGGPLRVPSMGFCLAINYLNAMNLRNVVNTDNCFVCEKEDFENHLSEYTDSTHFITEYVPTIYLSNLVGLDSLPHFYHSEFDTIEVINWDDFRKGVDIAYKVICENWY